MILFRFNYYKFINIIIKNIYLREKNWIDGLGKKWHHHSAFAVKKKFNKVKALNRWKNNLDYKELKFSWVSKPRVTP